MFCVLKNSDLLDFPGARSRLAIELEDINADIIPDLLLRGKVSYLFNKYSDDFNINNLLFCTNDKQMDVNEIPSLLYNWIVKNVGDNAYERNTALKNVSLPPLFVVFTFFNNQLKYDTTNDLDYPSDLQKLNYKWDARFNRFFENEIVTQTKDWHVNWTTDNPKFKNFYLLRDFKYSTDTFNGFEENGYELNIKAERLAYLEKLKQSFTNFNFVKNHFNDPLKSWEIASEINSDGTELIGNNLSEVSNNITKTNHYINKINNVVIDSKGELKKHLHTDDLALLRAKSMKGVNEIQFSLSSIITENINSFNKFILNLSVQPIEIYNLLNENIVVNINEKNISNLNQSRILINQYPELKNVNSFEQVLQILKIRLGLLSIQEVELFLDDKGIKKDSLFAKVESKSKAQFYVELVLNYWKSKIIDPLFLKDFIDAGLNHNSLFFLSDHFFKIIEKRGLKGKMELIINEIIS